MSRFFKSAAFPILIVVVLAFFAQKLISTGHAGASRRRTATSSRSSQRGEVKSVELKTKDNTVVVTLSGPATEVRDRLHRRRRRPPRSHSCSAAKDEHQLDGYNVEGRKTQRLAVAC